MQNTTKKPSRIYIKLGEKEKTKFCDQYFLTVFCLYWKSSLIQIERKQRCLKGW